MAEQVAKPALTPKVGPKGGAQKRLTKLSRDILRQWRLYVLLLLPLVYLIIFKYVPMYGVQIAFRDFNPAMGFTNSPWVGLKHFINFFNSHQFMRLVSNTLVLGFFSMLLGFPCPIILGISINEARSKVFGKTVQMVTYAPFFISTVILVSMIMQFLAVRGGLFNTFRGLLGMDPVNLMADPAMFRVIYILSGIWQGTGYGAVIYIAALANVNPELYEAAEIDGATILQKIFNIDLPSIMPVAIMMLIMNCGSIINVGYEKVLLMQNQLNMSTSDVISTYVYRMGITSAQYSYSSAIGLFNSVVSIILLLAVNWVSGKLSETSLF